MILALRPNDPLYSSQWHLAMIGRIGPNLNNTNSTLGIERVWANYTGQQIKVGVWDDGIQSTHWDLSSNYNPALQVSVNGSLNDGQPITNADGHGTSVAGLIAAANNGRGGVGVAYNAQVTAIRIFGGADDINANWSRYLQTLDGLSQFDVTNHSYGGAPDFQLGTDVAKFQAAAVNGRVGLGTVHVKSAGNSNIDGNGDALDASRFTVTVAAIGNSADGAITSYSTYGSHILVSAPAGSVTTDLLGSTAGYNGLLSGDYTNGFGGTSAAGPITAGAVALMLDANSHLGWRDVQNILSYSAIGVGSLYTGVTTNENATWKWNGANHWNGGGLHYSEDYGYGMINVWMMVRMAEVWSEIFPVPATSGNEVTITSGVLNINRAISDMSTLNYTFTITQNISLEHVALTTTLTHSYFTDLRIRLISPDGTVMTLYNGTSGNASTSDNGLSYTWGVDGLRGELSAGTWTVQIQDAATGDVGTLQSIQWTGFGSPVDINSVYHYTDEVLLVQAKANQSHRLQLIDSEGLDWINAAATSSNLYINLNDGFSSAINQTYFLTVANSTVIENVIGGDGNDYLIGNEFNNMLYGMRGNDLIRGGLGIDTVVYLDAQSNYLVAYESSYVRVTSLVDSSVDYLYGIEWLRFGDANSIAVSVADFQDTLGPELVGFSPSSNHQSVSINSPLRFIFDEAIQAGAGTIRITDGNGLLWRSISIASSEVQIEANTLILDLIDPFAYNTTYTVHFDAGLVQDSLGHLNLAMPGNLSFKTELDIYTITGTNAANTLTGNAADNRIFGLAGNDTLTDSLGGNDYLDGGLGSDRMSGGVGNDIYIVDSTGDVVTENANAGIDQVQSSVTWTLSANVEDLVLLGVGNINGTGNALANRIEGNSGANLLNGGAGADTLVGGLGNDVYVFDSLGDTLEEILNGGVDTVQSSVSVSAVVQAQMALIGEHIENITLTGSAAINAVGNIQANSIMGNSATNRLDAGSGNDVLNGGLGSDTLIGGQGNDIFVFNTALSNNNIDRVEGFSALDDLIHLENSIMRSLTATGTLNAANFVIGTRALDANDYIIYNPTNGAILYDADGSGRNAAVQLATLVGVVGTVTASDFVVI